MRSLKLNKIEIMGDNPIKYWEKDKIFCELEIINPECTIKTANIEATNQDLNNFKMHIYSLFFFVFLLFFFSNFIRVLIARLSLCFRWKGDIRNIDTLRVLPILPSIFDNFSVLLKFEQNLMHNLLDLEMAVLDSFNLVSDIGGLVLFYFFFPFYISSRFSSALPVDKNCVDEVG